MAVGFIKGGIEMILVTLGTQDKSFERLLVEIERLIDQKVIREKVIVQAGYTKYSSDKMEILDYLPKDEFEKLIHQSRILITHGGVGSIFDGLARDKKIIAVPRLSKYMEHTNDHQLQVVEKLGNEGYILPCTGVEDVEENLKKIRTFHPKKYKENNRQMLSLIENFIEEDSSHFNSGLFEYITFGVFFFIFQYLLSHLGFFQNIPSLQLCLIEWILSDIGILIFYSIFRHKWLKFSKRFLIFNFLCFMIHILSFVIFQSFFKFVECMVLSSCITIFLGYFIFMLIFGGRDFFSD